MKWPSMRSSILFFISMLTSAAFILSSCSGGELKDTGNLAVDSIPTDIRSITEKIAADRNNADLYFQRAKAYFAHKQFEPAIADMQIALKIDSLRPAYHIYLSDLYFTQNLTKDTRDELRKAMALDSSNAEAMMKYSQLFYLVKKFDTATYYINRSLHFNPSSPSAHFQKGMILKEWGDTLKAISSFQSALEYDQQHYDAYMQLALLFSVKKNPVAMDYYNNAQRIDPKSTEAHYGKGLLLQQMGQYDAAMAEYNAILSLMPEDQNATYNIGTLLFEKQETEEALKKFNLTTERDQNYFRGYYGAGRCYEAMDDLQKAKEAYRKALSIQPDFDLAAIQLDRLERKGGK